MLFRCNCFRIVERQFLFLPLNQLQKYSNSLTQGKRGCALVNVLEILFIYSFFLYTRLLSNWLKLIVSLLRNFVTIFCEFFDPI